MGVSGISNFKTPTPDRSDGMPAGLFTVLSALATSAVDGKRTATADLVQGIVDSANKLLALADGRANTPANQPSLEDFRLLGADLSSLGKAAIKTDYRPAAGAAWRWPDPVAGGGAGCTGEPQSPHRIQ